MSYNITSWRTVVLKDLVIPFDVLASANTFWKGTIDADTVSSLYGERTGIVGKVHGDDVYVTDIDCSGMGSGNDFNRLLGVLEHSTGELNAILIWEEGDTTLRLIVHNGVVLSEEIDL